MPEECKGYFYGCYCTHCNARAEGEFDYQEDYETAYEFEQYDDDYEEKPWTDEDEAALEEWEEQRRIRIAEANEY